MDLTRVRAPTAATTQYEHVLQRLLSHLAKKEQQELHDICDLVGYLHTAIKMVKQVLAICQVHFMSSMLCNDDITRHVFLISRCVYM